MEAATTSKSESGPKNGEKIRHFMKEVSEAVSEAISEHLADADFNNVREIVSHVHDTPGKRLRPALSAMIGMANGGDFDEIIKICIACEFMHGGTLNVDDVQDFDHLRRGAPTAMALFGLGTAVSSGIINACISLEIAMEKEHRMGLIAIRTLRKLCIGQTEEIQRTKPLDEDQYLRVIKYKTASLFSAAAQFGAILAGCDDERVKQAAIYGDAVGTLYQLCDDVVDAEKSLKVGKPLGDMKMGVITLPLIHTYRLTEKSDIREFILRFTSHHDVSDQEVLDLLEEMKKLKSTHYVRDEIEDYIDTARSQIEDWPDSNFKDMLYHMPLFMAEVILSEIEKDEER